MKKKKKERKEQSKRRNKAHRVSSASARFTPSTVPWPPPWLHPGQPASACSLTSTSSPLEPPTAPRSAVSAQSSVSHGTEVQAPQTALPNWSAQQAGDNTPAVGAAPEVGIAGALSAPPVSDGLPCGTMPGGEVGATHDHGCQSPEQLAPNTPSDKKNGGSSAGNNLPWD